MLHWIRVVLVSLVLAVVAAVCVGLIYEGIGGANDARKFPRIGEAHDIGGRKLNLYCQGTGTPPVIFEAGLGEVGFAWSLVQAGAAKFTRACWYDRAGYGWSDPGPDPRDSSHIADDLHALLRRAGITPPYVMVAHSFGGLPVRVFHGRYPAEVAGAVFADASHEDQFAGVNGVRTDNRPTLQTRLLPLAIGLGVPRLMRHFGPSPFASLPPTLGPTLDYLMSKASFYETAMAEMREMDPAGSAQARAAGTFRDKPLIVLTAGKPPAGDAWRKAWVDDWQPKLAKLSTRGRREMVNESGHMMLFDAPERIVSAVREVVEAVR